MPNSSDDETFPSDPALHLVASRPRAETIFGQLVYTVDGYWFFLTPDGIDLGPYPSREAAHEEAAQLGDLLSDIEDPAERLSLTFQLKLEKPEVRHTSGARRR